MSLLPPAQSFTDLIVYRKARNVAKRVFEVSKKFPKDKMYSLTDQLRRASRSIGAQIAEAWAKRRYEKHFFSKLTDADAEPQKTRHWIETASDCAYLTPADVQSLNGVLSEIGKMLNSMIEKADSFCSEPTMMLKDSTIAYFTTDY